jgi:hypothetical protein
LNREDEKKDVLPVDEGIGRTDFAVRGDTPLHSTNNRAGLGSCLSECLSYLEMNLAKALGIRRFTDYMSIWNRFAMYEFVLFDDRRVLVKSAFFPMAAHVIFSHIREKRGL